MRIIIRAVPILSIIQPVKWNTLRMSLHFKEDFHKERDDAYLPFAESKSYTGSWGLEDEFTLVKNLSLVGGVSYDWFDVTRPRKTSRIPKRAILCARPPTPSPIPVNSTP